MVTSTWQSLDEEAERVASNTNREAFEICSLLKDAVSVLADGFTMAEIRGTEAASAQAGLLSQNLNSLKCSVDLTIRGYYTQSVGVIRGVYENWIAFHYLIEFPLKVDLWLEEDKRPPKHSEMLNALGPAFIEDKGDARGWYGALCRYAHTDALGVLPHLGSYKGDPCAFIGAKYKPALFRGCAYTISLFTSIMLREMSHLIALDSHWQRQYNKTIEVLLQFIEDENVDFKKYRREPTSHLRRSWQKAAAPLNSQSSIEED